MKESEKAEIAQMMAEAIGNHKKEKSWFMKLGWFYKVVLGFVSFCVAVSTLGGGVSWFMQLVFQDEIMEYEDLRERVKSQAQLDSLIIHAVTINTESRTKAEGSKMYAVGYRAEMMDDGKIKRYYRDWDGSMHPIFPDPSSSTSMFTYWFFVKENGQKEYTYGK